MKIWICAAVLALAAASSDAVVCQFSKTSLGVTFNTFIWNSPFGNELVVDMDISMEPSSFFPSMWDDKHWIAFGLNPTATEDGMPGAEIYMLRVGNDSEGRLFLDLQQNRFATETRTPPVMADQLFQVNPASVQTSDDGLLLQARFVRPYDPRSVSGYYDLGSQPEWYVIDAIGHWYGGDRDPYYHHQAELYRDPIKIEDCDVAPAIGPTPTPTGTPPATEPTAEPTAPPTTPPTAIPIASETPASPPTPSATPAPSSMCDCTMEMRKCLYEIEEDFCEESYCMSHVCDISGDMKCILVEREVIRRAPSDGFVLRQEGIPCLKVLATVVEEL